MLIDFGFHLHADDTQMYLPLDIKSDAPFEKVEMCLIKIKSWMIMNKLRLNENKTEVLFITTSLLTEQQSTELDKLNFVGECLSFPTNEVVRNPSFYFGSKWNIEHHVKKLCLACRYHLRNIGKIRNLINAHTTHMRVHAFITSRLDYCNSLLVGIPKFLKERLQKKIQNKAARLITRKGEDELKNNIKRTALAANRSKSWF